MKKSVAFILTGVLVISSIIGTSTFTYLAKTQSNPNTTSISSKVHKNDEKKYETISANKKRATIKAERSTLTNNDFVVLIP